MAGFLIFSPRFEGQNMEKVIEYVRDFVHGI